MNLLGMRAAETARGDVLSAAQGFLAALVTGRGADCLSWLGHRLDWFGSLLDRTGWEAHVAALTADRKLELGTVRQVANPTVDLVPEDRHAALFGAALVPGDTLVLADLECDGQSVTAALVLRRQRGSWRVARAFEPTAFAEYVRGLAAAA